MIIKHGCLCGHFLFKDYFCKCSDGDNPFLCCFLSIFFFLHVVILRDRAAAGLLQRCSISSSWESLPGCYWKEYSCTAWWSWCSMPPFGPSTYSSLVMAHPLLSSLYLPLLDQRDMALTSSKCYSMCLHT